MPKIPTLDNPVRGLQPTELGVHARFQAGLHIGALYREAGYELGSAVGESINQAVEFQAHREISHGAAGYAGLISSLTDEWNKRAAAADPNDPAVAVKFHNEILNPALDKFQEGFLTQRGQTWATGRAEHLRDHFFQKTAADMSTLAGEAVKV